MDSPTYEVTITIGGSGQTTTSKIGTVLPSTIVTRQSGTLIVTAVDADGADFDLSSLGTMDLKAGIFGSAESSVTLGTGVISGAGSNIFTASWVRDVIPAGWSQFEFDKDGVVIIYLELQETGTADYFQWDTRLNVNDGSYTGNATVIPLSIIQYYNPTYEYDNTTTAADPTAGLFRADSVTLASITELYVNDFTQSNVDLQTHWQGLGVGSSVYIGNPNVKLESAYFTVSGAPTNGTDFTTIPVTFVSAGTSQFTNGSQFAITIDRLSESAPFSDATALVKNDADNTKLIKFSAASVTTGTTRTATFPDADGTVIYNIVEDTTPQLGSDLDLNGFKIPGLPDWQTLAASKYTATPASTSSITMSDTSDLKVGMALRYSDSGGPFYAIIDAIVANTSIAIKGAPFDTGDDLTALAFSFENVSQFSATVPGLYGASADANLLAVVAKFPFQWQGKKAYCVAFKASQETVDATAQPKININCNNLKVSTADSNNGIQLSTSNAFVENGAIAISSTNYEIEDGEELEIECTVAGTAGDAENLNVEMIFVTE